MPSCGCRPAALLRRSWPVVSMPLRRPGQQHLPDSSSPQRTGWQSPVPTVPCLQQLRRSAPASNIFPIALRCSAPASSIFQMALCHSAAILFAMALPAISSAAAPRPAALPRLCLSAVALPRRPGQQQTSSGGEEYSGLASNLAHLGRIC